MKKNYLIFAFCFLYFYGHAQVIYGDNNYTQYHPGTLPIIISVPHGGLVSPASIPDRTCNNPTTITDARTIELARQIDTALFILTGCRPHLIICNLQRAKVDCNRNLAEGACGNFQAEKAWNEFQFFIDTAQAIAQSMFPGKVFYIDLHGHGKPIPRLELGYGLSGNRLNNPDSVLNTPAFLATSSINNLVHSNRKAYTHAQLLRGPEALGTLLANAGFPAVPSEQTPHPGETDYFSGGYNTFNHTCISPINAVNGVQLECDQSVRFGYSSRKRFADSTASILLRYMLLHQNLNLLANCGLITSSTKNNRDAHLSFDIVPNPGSDLVQLTSDKLEGHYEVLILNTFGKIVFKANNQNQFSVSSFPKGVYFVLITKENKYSCVRKMVIQ